MQLWAGASYFVLLSHLSGGWRPLAELYQHVYGAIAGNEYAVQSQNGPGYSLIVGFFLLSPATAFLCAVGLARAFKHGAEESADVMGFLAVLFAGFLTAASLPAYFKNLRYLSPVYIPYYVLAAFTFVSVVQWLRRSLGSPAIAWAITFLLAGIIAGLDWSNFDAVFNRGQVKDLVNSQLMTKAIYVRPRG
jgi:hypothetical protein